MFHSAPSAYTLCDQQDESKMMFYMIAKYTLCDKHVCIAPSYTKNAILYHVTPRFLHLLHLIQSIHIANYPPKRCLMPP